MTARVPVVFSLVVAIALLVGGCTEDEAQPGSSPSAPETSEGVVTTSEDIDIGGRSLHLQCWGEAVPGEPTILLLAGAGPPTSYWQLMAADFAAEGHHLCGYDRAGIGGSEAAPEARRTTQDQVTDLVALLDATHLQEPLILVAHSAGSLPAVGLVDRAPERVAGVVLVDPLSPREGDALRAALPPKKPHESPELADERLFLTDYLFDPAQNGEHLVFAASEDEVARLLDEPGPIFGDIPVVVLRAPELPYLPGLPRRYHAATVKVIADGHQEFADESTHGAVIEVENTGHNIHEDQPDAVMDAIRDVLAG